MKIFFIIVNNIISKTKLDKINSWNNLYIVNNNYKMNILYVYVYMCIHNIYTDLFIIKNKIL